VIRSAGKEGELNYAFNASIYDSDGIDEPYSRMMSDTSGLHDAYGFSSHETTTGGKYTNNEKYFSLSANYRGFYSTVSYTEIKKGMTFSLPVPGDDGMVKKHSSSTVLFGYNKKLSDKITFDGRFTYSQSNAFYNWALFEESPHIGYENDFKFYETELDIFFCPIPDFDITLGLYYRSIFEMEQDIDEPFLSGFANFKWGLDKDDEINTRAIFTQVNYKPSEHLKFVAGLRLEQMMKHTIFFIEHYGYEDYYEGSNDNIDDVAIIPRFAVIYNLNDRQIVKMLYGKSINRSFTDNVNTRAIFTQINYDLLDNLKIVAGLRGEQVEKYSLAWSQGPAENMEYTEIKGVYDKDDIEVIPRFAAICTLNENNIFKLLHGKAINAPSLFQNSQQIQSGNENLEPEYIETF